MFASHGGQMTKKQWIYVCLLAVILSRIVIFGATKAATLRYHQQLREFQAEIGAQEKKAQLLAVARNRLSCTQRQCPPRF